MTPDEVEEGRLLLSPGATRLALILATVLAGTALVAACSSPALRSPAPAPPPNAPATAMPAPVQGDPFAEDCEGGDPGPYMVLYAMPGGPTREWVVTETCSMLAEQQAMIELPMEAVIIDVFPL